jgi:glutamate dehydrogenase
MLHSFLPRVWNMSAVQKEASPSSTNSVIADVTRAIHATDSAEKHTLTETVVETYLSDIDDTDLIERPAAEWATIVQNHLMFAQDFQSGAPKMRIFTPQVREQGSKASSTVIEFINDDMPFLVDSIAMEINRQGLSIRQIAHPLFAVSRDPHGTLTTISPPIAGQKLESWIHIEIERLTDPKRIKALGDGLVAILADVRAAVEDWAKMKSKVQDVLTNLGGAAKVVSLEELDEARAFLQWVAGNHFTFLGYRDYELVTQHGKDVLKIVANSGLGVLREPKLGGVSASFNELPDHLKRLARSPQLLVLTKANTRATVHRSGYLDYIGIKRFDADGQVVGERRFIGLYTSSGYHGDPTGIPLLRQKISKVMAQAGYPEGSHAGKNLLSILDDYPRDELFQIADDELFDTAMGILRLGERARTKLFIRRDLYARFYSCLIFLPRENYNTEIRVKLQELLKRRLNGTSAEFNVQLTESVLARIHMLIRTNPGSVSELDTNALETEIIALTRRWEEGVFADVAKALGEDAANAARHEFVLPFPVAYREDTSPSQAIDDFNASRNLTKEAPLNVTLYASEDGAHELRFRAYHLESPITLSKALPMLENMGVKVANERSYTIERNDHPAIHIHEYALTHNLPVLDIVGATAKFEATFLRAWAKTIENDGFNRLTLVAQLAAEDVLVLRTYAKYLKQTGFTYSQSYLEQTLSTHPNITRSLVALFHIRFNPAQEGDRSKRIAAMAAEIDTALDGVSNADEDRILRRFLAVIQATLRTNFHQHKAYLSIKLECASVPELPEPKPLYEIFVYSPRVEGIHLRGGKVARGGLRWSDRPEDFRTEVLGLVKAQMVKNAVIVPVGSKGGFVLKAAPPSNDREAYLKEGIECYKTFLRGLLDITDNLVKGKVVAPRNVVRHDADDPYLVVAADKGTATFSDYANAISAEYGHWLGDAFASGGSAGYDHKKMGITAKGAWESVKRHFREIGVNTQTTDFTVVGVGDMSGDVFGNGMLLSRHIRLVAAFDHRHIFLDPTPDAAKSFAERERMFGLPRSSWEDYDKAIISKGGGVHARAAKSIDLTPEVKQALGIDATIFAMTPVELMRAILKAPVDLFYNGGIGTYIKASGQSHGEVGDKATDAIRINGDQLRCKVVAEGGNLGATQLGRVEAALAGVRICTDAIDNSAGVDCSDHEVNIKILLGAAVDGGLLKPDEREPLLAAMTDEVGKLVLKDNYYQTQSLSVSGVRADKMLDAQARFMRHQEKAGRLNRAVEFLPNDDALAERREKKLGLTAPERAVLLAYSKMELFDDLLASDLVDDPYVAQALVSYFPTPLQVRFKDIMQAHPLKREIIATDVANSTINRTGSVFVHRMCEEAGATAPEVVRAYILSRDVLGLNGIWQQIDHLDNVVPAATQNAMLIEVGRLVLRSTLWFLRRRGERMPITDVLAFFAPGVASVGGQLETLLATEDATTSQNKRDSLVAEGVPRELANAIAHTDAMYSLLDIVEASSELKRPVTVAAAVYFTLAGKLSLNWVAAQVGKLPTDSHWQAMARASMRDDLANLQRQLTESVLQLSPDANSLEGARQALTVWETHHAKALAHMYEVMDDLKTARDTDLAMLSVLLRELRVLA